MNLPAASGRGILKIMINLIMAVYVILVVGAASSCDHAMIAIAQLFSRLEAAPTRNRAILV
jgi:hypothetical protein